MTILNSQFIYHRKELAEEYCRILSGRSPVNNATSGLFLAAPRRTGKSTFLRQDLVPEAENLDWLPIYVDLWADKTRNPAELIAEAIAAELDKHAPVAKRALRAIGISKVGAAGTTIDIGDGKSQGGITIGAALKKLWEKLLKPIMLVIDEAQHALTTPEGDKALFALKAARDELNQEAGKGTRLLLVMTGSSRDKLTFMVANRKQAFYGAEITRFPLLDDKFVEAYAKDFNRQFNTAHQFTLDAMKKAFELVGRRPEKLRAAVSEAVANCLGPNGLAEMVTTGAAKLQQAAWDEFSNSYTRLTPPQKAVLDAIARLTPNYEPYGAEAMEAYQKVLGSEPKSSTIQGAIKALQVRELVWQSARGSYAFDDELLRDYYLRQMYPEPPNLALAGQSASRSKLRTEK